MTQQKGKSPAITHPMFSIIVPVYNVREYITITIQSILSQTLSDFELLAIDDGSTDGSGELLDNLALSDNRIRVFHQPNSGVSAARNLGLDEARGEWILFVDGDDALRYDALETLSSCIKRNPNADLVGYMFKKTDQITPEILRTHQVENILDKHMEEQVYDCTENVCFDALNHYMVWTETYKRNILGDLRFKPLRNGEDVLFCNSVAIRCNNYIALKAPIYLYLQRSPSAKSNKWTSQRHGDYIALHNGIMHNILTSNKTINPSWIKRWIGNLLQYSFEVRSFDKSTRKRFFNQHRSLLKQIKKLSNISFALKIWLILSTLFSSERYFRFTAMMPMSIYSKFKQFYK